MLSWYTLNLAEAVKCVSVSLETVRESENVVKTEFPAKDRNTKLDKRRAETTVTVRMNHGACMHFALQDDCAGKSAT